MLDTAYLESFSVALRAHHNFERFDHGLSDGEVDEIQRRFGISLPPDLREILQFALPIGKGFPNWRDDDAADLQLRLEGPLDGVWFDVEQNAFWLDAWGSRPNHVEARFAIVKASIQNAPQLVPVYAHRFIPSEPDESGNPVFSVHQTDIILYGNDLVDYFHREFHVPLPPWAARSPRCIRVWSDALTWRD